MTDLYDRFRCEACGDEHEERDRIKDGGRRLCPECGHHVAEPIIVGWGGETPDA